MHSKEIYPRHVRTKTPEWVYEELERRARSEEKTLAAVVRETLIVSLKGSKPYQAG